MSKVAVIYNSAVMQVKSDRVVSSHFDPTPSFPVFLDGDTYQSDHKKFSV